MASDFALYSLVWLKSVHKDFEKLSLKDQKIIIKKIDLLVSAWHDALDIKKLRGLANLYRLRVGDYRIVFVVENEVKQIRIVAIGHRRDIYSGIGH